MAEPINDVAITEEVVMSKIYIIRIVKVMLDRELATLYGVETKIPEKAGKEKPYSFSGRFYV